ncbi:hypothetical protein LCGC14_0391640 [marine sediment metagenome]|uniref:Uncharacterized protein n=1 Tax=marine sediment metagenome TaxID=412755 RepID=A0A0F9W8J1_9ZZZZ
MRRERTLLSNPHEWARLTVETLASLERDDVVAARRGRLHPPDGGRSERVVFDVQGGSLKVDGVRARGQDRVFDVRGADLTATDVDID